MNGLEKLVLLLIMCTSVVDTPIIALALYYVRGCYVLALPDALTALGRPPAVCLALSSRVNQGSSTLGAPHKKAYLDV